jgi:hypothetical protein
MSDFSANFLFSPCLHRHVVPVTTGSRHFSQGEVYDDIQDLLQCTECLEYVTEAEVRSAWNGKSLEEGSTLQMEDDFEVDVFPKREEVKEWQQQIGKKSCSIPRSLLHKRVSASK